MTIRIIRRGSLGLEPGVIRTFSSSVEAALIADKEAVAHTETESLAGPVVADAAGNLFANGKQLSPVSGASFTVKAVLGIAGQSNEAGSTLAPDSLGTLQRYTVSVPEQGLVEPVKLQTAGTGSMFTEVTRLLARDGVKVDLHNGAIGGSSFYMDWTGFVYMAGRANSTPYRGKRASLGTGDPGTRGDLIFVNGAVWEATTGNKHLAFWGDSSNPVTVNGVQYFSDPGVIVKETNLVTASSPPTFQASPTVGDVTVDGGITWTCISVGAKITDAGSVHVNRRTEIGFDPYFITKRLLDSLMSVQINKTKRFVYFQNGQSDAGVATNIYAVALRELGQYFGQAPYYVQPIYGLSIFNTSSNQANWDLLETAISGGGLGTTPNYTAVGTVGEKINSAGYHKHVLGTAVTDFGWYVGQSLYRAFGMSTASMLQADGTHTTPDGMKLCAAALYPELSKIFRNSAT
ncbi:MAG TPA: hypothetical protein VGE36_13750 [Roseateles sp.]